MGTTMETCTVSWSELCNDILSCVFERLSFVDTQRAKMVCSNWYSCSKQKLRPKSGSPWLILSLEDDCVMYNPEEDRIYKSKRDFSKIRILGNSGKWLLVLDPVSNLYIIDAFSDKKINLPRLDSIKGYYSHEQVGDKEFKLRMSGCRSEFYQNAENLRGLLWVDDEKGEHVVVWYFEVSYYIGFCKNGEDHYTEITTRDDIQLELRLALPGVNDMVLVGYKLYILNFGSCIRVLDLSVQECGGYKDMSPNDKLPMLQPPFSVSEDDEFTSFTRNIAVTRSGEVLLVCSTIGRKMRRIWHLYKRDPNPDPDIKYQNLIEDSSLGDEALFLHLGITLPADSTLGIEPNSVYFTRDGRFKARETFSLDISVSHLAKQTNTRFPHLSSLNLKDARWFLPA